MLIKFTTLTRRHNNITIKLDHSFVNKHNVYFTANKTKQLNK